ncbi:MAG: hypothetical protein K4H23_03445 [Mollicutes bacterium PWAP]|nr:hypothetical protein [Mollicutes bacterium PWAP]
MEKIVSIGKSYVIYNSGNNGYIIYIANKEDFKIIKKMKMFIYEYKNEYLSTLYGFKTFKDRIFFDDLVKMPGIWPKTALNLLRDGSW